MTDKFKTLIQEHLDALLNEQEPGEDAAAVDPNAAPPAEPVADDQSVLPDEGEAPGEDDNIKLKIDLYELVRKALIIPPNVLNAMDNAKIRKVVGPDNIDTLPEDLERIVNDNYPYPDDR